MSASAVQPIPQGDARQRRALALMQRRASLHPAMIESAGFSGVEELTQVVADFMKLPRLSLADMDIAPDLAKWISKAVAQKNGLVPVFMNGDELTVATCDPARIEVFDWLAREIKRQVVITVAAPAEVDAAIARLYETVSVVKPTAGELVEVSAEALTEATEVVDRLILRAVEMSASDIHIEATAKHTVVRFRVDGSLRQIDARPIELHPALISRIKVMAQLDISERHAPQDGRIKVRGAKNEIDLRVSILPTYFGEKVVCRVLDNTRASLPLSALGFEEEQLQIFNRMIRTPYGLLLVTGPTGSGKSTTLYGALNAVRSPDVNIVTVEDPVEYQLQGINQVQVNAKRGMTFGGALRSILRQDPNIILVGEIRDQETGEIAAEAALTGHLVMASLHTNDAVTAVTRLTEMGIEPYLVAPSLVGVIAQRLIRKVCSKCAESYTPSAEELSALGLPALPAGTQFRRGVGCAACQKIGYSGRTAIRELLEISSEMKAAIGRGASAEELRGLATAKGFRGMRFSAMKKLFAGLTSTEEVIRVTRE